MNMNLDAGRNSSKFPTPVLGDEARALYSKLYGSDGPRFIGKGLFGGSIER